MRERKREKEGEREKSGIQFRVNAMLQSDKNPNVSMMFGSRKVLIILFL